MDLEELAAVFAVEAMTPGEKNLYREHLGICQVCEGLVDQFQGAAELLPLALATEPVSPGLKPKILAQARAESDSNRAQDRPRWVTQGPRFLSWLWPAGVSPLPVATMAALLMLVVGLAAWNIVLYQDVREQNKVLLQYQEVLSAIAIGGNVHQVRGTEAAPEAAAVLIQNPGREDSVLIVSGLASLPVGMEYQVWRITGSGVPPIGAGTFGIIDSRTHLVPLSTTFSATESIGVSVEPAGGSPAPTGDIVLLGAL